MRRVIARDTPGFYKVAERSYRVYLEGEHWGNVYGYADSAGWAAIWFRWPGREDKATDGEHHIKTRREAAQLIVTGTAKDRRIRNA